MIQLIPVILPYQKILGVLGHLKLEIRLLLHRDGRGLLGGCDIEDLVTQDQNPILLQHQYLILIELKAALKHRNGLNHLFVCDLYWLEPPELRRDNASLNVIANYAGGDHGVVPIQLC